MGVDADPFGGKRKDRQARTLASRLLLGERHWKSGGLVDNDQSRRRGCGARPGLCWGRLHVNVGE